MWSSTAYGTYAEAKAAFEAMDGCSDAQIIPFMEGSKQKFIIATPGFPTTTLSAFHARICEGMAWRGSWYSATGAGPFYFVFSPGEDAEPIKLQFEGASNKTLLVEFFEDATLEALGTTVQEYGFNRVDSEDCDWGITHTPTLGVGGTYGTKCAPDISSLVGTHPLSSPGGGGNANFTILDPEKIYVVKVTPGESGIVYTYMRLWR